MGKGKDKRVNEFQAHRRKRKSKAAIAGGGVKKKKVSKNKDKQEEEEVVVLPKWHKRPESSRVPDLQLPTSSKVRCDRSEAAKKNAHPKFYKMSSPVTIDSGHSVLKGMDMHSEGFISTWAQDGGIRIWRLRGTNGAMTSICSAHLHECPQDMEWHPDGNRLFAAFKSTGRAQVGYYDLSDDRFRLLPGEPHCTGLLRSIKFMPWQASGAPCFATGGDDHSVVLWKESQEHWTSQKLYNSHSSFVYGVAGAAHKSLIASASVDKHLRMVDVVSGTDYFCGKFDSSLLSVEFNPVDPNLLLLTGCVEKKQLMLMDLRYLDPESLVHSFGWEIGENHPRVTRQFQQCWSPDGWYVSTGSCEDGYDIFDIRYNNYLSTHSVHGTKSGVVKTQWHPVVNDLLISAIRGGRIWLQQII
ncbi:uncharacterized protein LOC9651892 [Selaginella moellendorffii]|uniref:uncharacterized protein LOC9651892 n=1 Tax=Selaginella moellendorffii TaxID=88036 RepID=UPI000D1C50D9|nr:uncharacterized protein LOC9651892 [Selaginella moellendorffii]XP_024517408.1 uncharacterized protein LOC9651892 [Selaginella moellendorffii]|eukprot:XP_024517407.1 uncharacterized protein LOC9651892 [Selaginella moellendorffii]